MEANIGLQGKDCSVVCCGKRVKALCLEVFCRRETQPIDWGSGMLLSQVDVGTHLHIRDSIFWVQSNFIVLRLVKLEMRLLHFKEDSFHPNSVIYLLLTERIILDSPHKVSSFFFFFKCYNLFQSLISGILLF